jgi:hypothetical protein
MSVGDDFATGWRPKAGDRIEGRITSIDVRHGEYEPYPIITIVDEGGEPVAVHAFHDVLRNELAKLQPEVGDRLVVVYRGQKEGRSGSRYHSYAVETPDRPPPPFDWGMFGGDASREEQPPPPEQTELPESWKPSESDAPKEQEDPADDDLPF